MIDNIIEELINSAHEFTDEMFNEKYENCPDKDTEKCIGSKCFCPGSKPYTKDEYEVRR